MLAYLFATFDSVKKKQVRTWLKTQAILVNGRPVTQFNHLLAAGDSVAVRSDPFAIPKRELASGIKIHFEDPTLIVIDKPVNLLSMASESEHERTAYFQLTEYVQHNKPQSRDRVWLVHRLDRETSGLMVFAKSAEATAILQAGWDKAEKRYEAVVEGRMPSDAGVFESHLNESNPMKVFIAQPGAQTRQAVTRYRVLERDKGRTLVELTLETGRRHQIRVQLAEAGFPIVGDKKYGAKSDPAKRLGLHACSLSFVHPKRGDQMRFDSPMPKQLVRLV